MNTAKTAAIIIESEQMTTTPKSVSVLSSTRPPTKGEMTEAIRLPTLHMPTTELRIAVGNAWGVYEYSIENATIVMNTKANDSASN